MTEKELQEKLANYLRQYFIVELEVWSDDRKSRIDIAMIHKSDIQKQYPVGIEIKTDAKKTGSSLGQWLKQAVVYTQKEFCGYGKMMIITYPQITDKCITEGDLMHKHDSSVKGDLACQNNINTFLGQFNIGELQRYRDNNIEYLRIVCNSRLFWDNQRDQIRPHNYLFGCKK